MTEENKIKILQNVPITEIKPYEKNYQKHDANLEHIKNSIKDFDFDVPIVVDVNNVIVKGHGRYEALKELGKDTIPLVAINMALDTKKKASAARIADNESSKAAVVDNDILKFELDLIGEDFEMEDYGLDLGNFDIEILEPEETEGDDDVPESAPAITVLGDIYELGGVHRVMCGDSTMIDQVEKLMDGAKADMVFTDPPYGVAYTGGVIHGNKINTNNKRDMIKNDEDLDIYQNWLSIVGNYIDNGALYIFYATRNSERIFTPLKEFGFDLHAVIAWVKINTGYADMNSHYKNKYEPCVYAKKTGKKLNFMGATTENTVWEIEKDRNNKMHPTQKPVAVPERAINNSSKVGELIMDSFLGSGSTLIACEKTNRKCYGMELDPKYCDVIVKRYVTFCKANNKPYSVFRNGKVCKDFE
jgi:site-specific DNA-methyltransferase (adenine-specific)